MTPQQFDACTVEEREMILERRALLERERAISRPCALALALQGADSKTLWTARARELVKETPELLFEIGALAQRVLDWSNERGIVKNNGKPYASKTIYSHISRTRENLVTEGGDAA